jgi:hypothetical protein
MYCLVPRVEHRSFRIGLEKRVIFGVHDSSPEIPGSARGLSGARQSGIRGGQGNQAVEECPPQQGVIPRSPPCTADAVFRFKSGGAHFVTS